MAKNPANTAAVSASQQYAAKPAASSASGSWQQSAQTQTAPRPQAPNESTQQAQNRRFSSAAETTRKITDDSEMPDVNLGRLGYVDEEPQKALLEQMNAAAKRQTELSSDYATEQGIRELERAKEDAAAGFQSERDRIAAEELRNLDNQALYAQARGDRGGIGQAQYSSIQNTAAANRAAVNREQLKLASDTARRIADLRSKGEFEKADRLLELTQSHLSELMNLNRWAQETNMDADEFNLKLAQWEADYDMAARKYRTDTQLNAAKITGAFSDGTPTHEAQENYRRELASAGAAMIAAGMRPTDAQLEAMGLTSAQYAALYG